MSQNLSYLNWRFTYNTYFLCNSKGKWSCYSLLQQAVRLQLQMVERSRILYQKSRRIHEKVLQEDLRLLIGLWSKLLTILSKYDYKIKIHVDKWNIWILQMSLIKNFNALVTKLKWYFSYWKWFITMICPTLLIVDLHKYLILICPNMIVVVFIMIVILIMWWLWYWLWLFWFFFPSTNITWRRITSLIQ